MPRGIYRRKGSPFWYVKGLRISTGTASEEDAEAYAAKLKTDAWVHRRMGIKPPKSWQQAVVQWCEEKQGKPSLKDDLLRFRWLDKHLGKVDDLSKIDRELMHNIMLKRGVNLADKASENTTANKYVSLVASVLRAAETQWGWNVRCPRFRTYKSADSPGRALTVQEWEKLSVELPDHLRRIATFALATGLRMEKVYSLTWSQVDFERRSLTHGGTVNKLANVIPLNDTALAMILEAKADKVVHKERIFTRNGRALKYYGKSAWRGALERAGVPRIRFHDLRHTFVSWLAQNGVGKEIRMRLAGHGTQDSHDRYTHMSVEALLPHSRVIDTVLAHQPAKQQAKG